MGGRGAGGERERGGGERKGGGEREGGGRDVGDGKDKEVGVGAVDGGDFEGEGGAGESNVPGTS